MTVEDLLTDNAYTFEIQEELIRNSESDSWKEIPVKVDALTETTSSDQQMTDDGQKQHHDVSDADDKDATVAGAAFAAAAQPTQAHQSESQLSGRSDCSCYFGFVVILA